MTRLDIKARMALLHDMVLLRRFEERCAQLYQETKIRGFMHLYVGEEAVAAGVGHVLLPHDNAVGTYREHGHALIKGVPADAVMAEMFGRVDGCSRGRGGSMHLFDVDHRFYGGNAIVGGGLPIAVGLALADRLSGREAVTACYFGEGAVAEGEFHETMNLAALWNLPVMFCCENNLYAMGTALDRSEAVTDLALRASGYGMPAWPVDGMDVEAVVDVSDHAAEYIRRGGGPAFVEYRTYRFRAHSMYDPELYRSKDEVAQWRKRDPIAILADGPRIARRRSPSLGRALRLTPARSVAGHPRHHHFGGAMNDLRQTVRDAICRVAPDVDTASIPDDVEFREAADLDSMDLLAVLGEVSRMTGVEVPEADYDSITTVGDFAAYLGARLDA